MFGFGADVSPCFLSLPAILMWFVTFLCAQLLWTLWKAVPEMTGEVGLAKRSWERRLELKRR